MNENGEKTSQLFAYVKFMLLMAVFLIALNVGVYFMNFYAGLLMSLGLVVYIIIILIYYYYRKRKALQELVTYAASFSSLQTDLMEKFAFPYLLLDKNAGILWGNEEFKKLAGSDFKEVRQNVMSIFPELDPQEFPKSSKTSKPKQKEIVYKNRIFNADIRFITDNNTLPVYDMPDIRPADLTKVYAVSLFDETELREYIRKYEDETLVPALLYLDNYDETLEMLDDIKRSIMMAVVDRKLNQYFGEKDAIIRKFERDKYIVLMRNITFRALKENKFPLLSEVKSLNVGNDMTVTVSMGIGTHQNSLTKDLEAARISIDLALGRGGDQVVIKDGDGIQYFGGKTMAVEKNTKVKARVKAHALYEFMSVAERVMIMGHRMPDPDAIGAAVGINAAARTIHKKANIVIDTESPSIKTLMNTFRNNPDFEEDMFISCDTAKELITEGTVLIVVDTCNAEIVCCPELLGRTKSIVVLDHHRLSSNVIKNTVLSYVEPYASSACEMIAEILQYFPENVKLKSVEADALYAGIVIDTDNFILKTGVRTFEASAYLRRCGADSVRVRKMFREDIGDYIARERIISNVELYRKTMAISLCKDSTAVDPTVVGAQAANSLLNIKGVKASFVLTDYNNMIYISARAIDEVNVQFIMERLGGGGHINIAGCQIPGMTIEEAEIKLKEVLDEMIDGGEI